MEFQSKNIFVNLPVKDLKQTKDFFLRIGFGFNAQFTDEKAACMVIGENIFAMLLVEGFFKTFTKKEIPDADKSAEVMVVLSAVSREEVNEIVNKANAAGGKIMDPPIDKSFIYEWGFQDIDGHIWKLVHMDESVIEKK